MRLQNAIPKKKEKGNRAKQSAVSAPLVPVLHCHHINLLCTSMQCMYMQDVDSVSAAIKLSPLKLQPRVEGNEVQVTIPRWGTATLEKDGGMRWT